MKPKTFENHNPVGSSILGGKGYADIERTTLEEQFLVLAGEFHQKIEVELQNYTRRCTEQDARVAEALSSFVEKKEFDCAYSNFREEKLKLENRVIDVEDEQASTIGFLKFIFYTCLLSISMSAFSFVAALKYLFTG
jgi:hypothetical protein